MESIVVPTMQTMSHRQQIGGRQQKGRTAPVPEVVPPLPATAGPVAAIAPLPGCAAAATAVAVPDDVYSHKNIAGMVVIPSASRVGGHYTEHTVVVKSLKTMKTHGRRGFAEAIEDLNSPKSRDLAMVYAAAHGMSRPTVRGYGSATACNADGLPVIPHGGELDHYRAVVTVSEGNSHVGV